MESEHLIAAEEMLFERSNEIQKHIKFLKTLIEKRVDRLARFDKKAAFEIINFDIDRDFTKTQLATTYLLLYNLIEAVVTQIFYSVHEVIKEEELAYDELSEKLQSIYLKNFKNIVKDSQGIKFSNFLNREISRTLGKVLTIAEHDKEKLFSGNITSKVVRDSFQDYGIEIADHDRSKSRCGACFELIKDRRNELAHGAISFVDCGQSTSVDDLERYLSEVQEYLRALILSTSLYLQAGNYRNTISA